MSKFRWVVLWSLIVATYQSVLWYLKFFVHSIYITYIKRNPMFWMDQFFPCNHWKKKEFRIGVFTPVFSKRTLATFFIREHRWVVTCFSVQDEIFYVTCYLSHSSPLLMRVVDVFDVFVSYQINVLERVKTPHINDRFQYSSNDFILKHWNWKQLKNSDDNDDTQWFDDLNDDNNVKHTNKLFFSNRNSNRGSKMGKHMNS